MASSVSVSTSGQLPGVDRLRPQPHPRRRHLCGGGPAAGARRKVQDPGKALVARALVHLPGRPGQETVRALQRAIHRDRYHRCGVRRVRPGARLLPAGHADSLQPGNQKHAGAQGAGHDPWPPHRMGCRLERYRRRLPDHQARRDHQRPDHLQRIAHRRHRPCRHRLGGDARAGPRTPQRPQEAAQPLVHPRRQP